VPDRYALDTDVYVSALRNANAAASLKRFHVRFGTRTFLHAVVAMELRAGVRTNAHARALESLFEPYRVRDRIIAPSFEACLQAGRALSALAVKEGWQPGGSSIGDALLACSCRNAGVVLVTENVGHFAALQRHVRGFRFTLWNERA
jgi:predicted nucleic acid-binding protein